jgi:hypothetical protein
MYVERSEPAKLLGMLKIYIEDAKLLKLGDYL